MPAASIRPPTKARLVALFQADLRLSDVQVAYGFPGDEEAESVLVGAVTGTTTLQAMRSGAAGIPRMDDYQIDVWCTSVVDHPDQLTAEERVAVMANVVEEIVARNPQLTNADFLPIDGLLLAAASLETGPDGSPTPSGGYGAEALVRVRCKAFLT